VATLMYHCGVSVKMNYNVASEGGSTAYTLASSNPICAEKFTENLFRLLHYSAGQIEIRLHRLRVDHPSENRTNASRPMIYRGTGTGGGHCFVCDGYDNSDYFHFNWGWGEVKTVIFSLPR